MHRALLRASGLVLLAGGLVALPPEVGAAPGPQPTAQLYATVARSVVRIEVRHGPSIFATPGAGSGVVIGAGGLLATADHVIAGASEVWVVAGGGTRQRAVVLARLPDRDLALLRIDAPGSWPPLRPQDPVVARPGECVAAVGNVLGMTIGIFSGIVAATFCEDCRAGEIDQVLTDIAAPPGLSGGALVDCATGALVGIVSYGIVALNSRSPAAGIVGAVPASHLALLLNDAGACDTNQQPGC